MDSEDWIKQVGKPNSMGFRDEAKLTPVRVKSPGPALFNNGESNFVGSIQKGITNCAFGVLIRQLNGIGAEPLCAYNRYRPIRKDASDNRIRFEVFKFSDDINLRTSTALR